MKVPAIVEQAKKSLEQGYCVVIGLQTTGEVSSKNLACNNGDICLGGNTSFSSDSRMDKICSVSAKILQLETFSLCIFQASLESEQSKSGTPLSGFVSLCKEIYCRFVEQHFPTRNDRFVRAPSFRCLFCPWHAKACHLILQFRALNVPICSCCETG